MRRLTAREIAQLNDIDVFTRQMRFGKMFDNMIPSTGTPVNAVSASMALAISGVVISGETVDIGADRYEFLTDAAQVKDIPENIAVDIEGDAVKASVELTVDTQPSSGDTMTIGTKIFTFVPVGTANADGEISIGADLAGAQEAIVAAINGLDGFNQAHDLVSAGDFALDVCAVTALVGGTVGNTIASTENFTAGTNVFAAEALADGADCSAANAVTALVLAITNNDTQGVSAADGTGDTVDLTANIGAAGNDISLAVDMANGAFTDDADSMAGGVDGTIGVAGQRMIDDTYIYTCVADNTVGGKNWRRVAFGDAY